jgi:ABC-type Fe3+/spermidine/putrescine transport system ATPase subunit
MNMSARNRQGLNPAGPDGSVQVGDSPVTATAANASPARSGEFLVLDAVTKEFGSRTAVQPTTLTFSAGEFVTLLGPSGCGKTTLLRLIGGFEHPTTGEIFFRGQNLAGVPPERRPFNMVFQSYALFPHLSVYDNIAYGLRSAKLPEAEVHRRVLAALKLVGLGGEARAAVGQLSGGMSQRVALVRALVREPDILLLDEPLGALDLQLRKRMQMELREIQRQTGATFIYVTHDQEEALVMSQRVVIMQNGRVVQVGAPADVYHNPQTRFAAEFIGTASILPATVVRSEGRSAEVMVAKSLPVEARIPHGRTYSPGQAGVLAVRPEDLRIDETASGRGLPGVVVDGIFLGESTHVRVTLDGLDTVRVQWTGSVDAIPRPGQRVAVEPLPAHATFLLEE